MAKRITPADAKRLSLPGRRSSAIIDGEQGAHSASMRLVEIDAPDPDAAPRGPHVHHTFEECIYVLSGAGVTETESGRFPVTAGDTLWVPAGERHVTHNTGSEVLRLLCFFPVADVASGTEEFSDWGKAKAS